MQQVDSYGDFGIVALDDEDLATIRGGFWGAVAAGLFVAVLVHFDEFAEGFQEGFAYARGN